MSGKGLEARFLQNGFNNCEDVEIIELLLRVQLNTLDHRFEAQELLDHYGSLSRVIDAAADTPFDGSPISMDYRLGLRLPHEIANRYLYEKVKYGPPLSSPQEVVDYLSHSMRGLKVEHFKVLYMNGMNRLIDEEDLFKGTVGQAIVYPREVMKSALEHHASGLIIAHNHASGDPKPSTDDLKITGRLSAAAKLFDITVHDHIIIGGNGYFSFQEKGLLTKC